MKRINLYVPEPLLQKLQDESKQRDIPVAELIRRAVEAYLESLAKR